MDSVLFARLDMFLCGVNIGMILAICAVGWGDLTRGE